MPPALFSDGQATVAQQDRPVTPRTRSRDQDLPKSASYTSFPAATDPVYAKIATVPVRIRSVGSSDDLTLQLEDEGLSPSHSSGWNTPVEDVEISSIPVDDLLGPKLETISQHSYEESFSSSDKARSVGGSSQDVELESEQPIHTQESLAKRLGRKISVLPSKSTSPTRLEKKTSDPTSGRITSRPPLRQVLSSAKRSTPDNAGSASEAQSVARPAHVTRNNTDLPEQESLRRPSRTLLPTSFSTDRLPSVVDYHEDAMPLPPSRLLNTDRNSSVISLSLPKKRDELWSVFRSLDGDFTKFSSKSTNFKASVIRQSLLPFLRNYADHPTNLNLRPEDLSRRVTILNKWWVGLLELIHGRHNQSMSGTDRPTILDALSGIMDRPEWRPASSIYAPLSYRNTTTPSDSARKSTTSLASSGSDFLTESVLHNVRNLFVQNLTNQMSFVIEKMSLRNASASLVTFCGKAIAWAFFFCPAVGEVLVREWNIGADRMKRVLQTHGIGRFDNLRESADYTSSSFPPAIRPMAYSSLSKMVRELKTPAQLPPMSPELQMYGFWKDRWLGRESDLFYTFVKHYFILVDEYLPADADSKQRISSPGMLLVQSQILDNLDSTINRQAGGPADSQEPPSTTFDDMLGGTDAFASTLPILPPNATRIMSENRLIMLIRDFLSERVTECTAPRHMFAVTFCELLSASARGISLFNHAACYTLCDFLEEALVVLNRYEASPNCPAPVVDFDFWLDVFRKMLDSHNTVTEIRVFAFLYSSWNQICAGSERKEALCLDLLLSKDVFEKSFTHWCPMVRAYFLRLVCWRLVRFDEESNDLEGLIVQRAAENLRTLWSYYLFEAQQAEESGQTLGVVKACDPAPGRKFMIVRTDAQVAPGGAFLAFNGMLPPPPSGVVERSSAMAGDLPHGRPASIASDDSSPSPDRDNGSGLRGFFKGIMGTSRRRSSSRHGHSSSTPASPSRDDGSQRPRDRQALSRAPDPPAFRSYCFKFSLESSTRPHPRQVARQVARAAASAPSKKSLAHPRLPLAAEKYLSTLGVDMADAQPCKPIGAVQAQYVARALAEWAQVVGECQGFFERRLAEGAPRGRAVETPALGVELFRKSA